MDENKIFCTNCGCPIEDQSTGVCPNCGTPILPPQDNNGNFDNTYNGYDNQNMYYDMPTNNPQPKKSNALAIIIAIVVILCGGCFGAMYTGVIDGAKFGIVNQQKALEKIDKYIKNSEYEKACNYALVVQRAKPKNRELLEKLVVTINPVNSFKAYKMVENYANKVGEKNLDDTVKKWIEIGKTPVEIPYIEPNGGTYVYPPNVQMEFDATILGRGIFYTTDGSEPTEESNLYYNGVKIENDCQLKYFVINGVGEKSEVKTIDYEIDGELQKKVEDAGIEIMEVRITHLSYAEEIAAAMLQRQQATAIIAARQKIVEGAVSMVKMAIDQLGEEEIVVLDEERKAAMVSNLLVVLCGNKEAQPIVNSGSIY